MIENEGKKNLVEGGEEKASSNGDTARTQGIGKVQFPTITPQGGRPTLGKL